MKTVVKYLTVVLLLLCTLTSHAQKRRTQSTANPAVSAYVLAAERAMKQQGQTGINSSVQAMDDYLIVTIVYPYGNKNLSKTSDATWEKIEAKFNSKRNTYIPLIGNIFGMRVSSAYDLPVSAVVFRFIDAFNNERICTVSYREE